VESKNQSETGANPSEQVVRKIVTETITPIGDKSIDKRSKDDGQKAPENKPEVVSEQDVFDTPEEFEKLPEYLPHSEGCQASKHFVRACKKSVDDEYLSSKPSEHYQYTSARVSKHGRI